MLRIKALMNKLLPLLFFFAASNVSAQKVYDGIPKDSLIITFENIDSVKRKNFIDTLGSNLWKIGTTSKAFFALGLGNLKAIMTDTVSTYTINANDYFVLKYPYTFNTIISFTHKYETTLGKDGGLVEFSIDTGKTWVNLLGDCNADSSSLGWKTGNFYKKTDTLLTSQPAFTGSSSTWIESRFQYFQGFPIRTTGTTGNHCNPTGSILIRFRFISDSIPDTLDGWIISKIKIENDKYPGSVNNYMQPNSLQICPNPSNTGIFNFPQLDKEKNYSIEIFNAVGERIFNSNYKRQVDLSNNTQGLYYYRVTNGETQYSGKIVLQ